ncbi:MAG TPA: PAC2 family protein [Nitrososphaera sp.]|nr:PAC2 family protein [Nitrososphaera sp.]
MDKGINSVNMGNDTERTIIKSVATNSTVTLNDAILIAGFPGPGLVGSISANYIIEQEKMHQIAYVDSDYIAPGVMYIGGRLRHPVRVYANNEGTACVLVCDAPIILYGIRPLLNTVVKWAKSNDVREVMVLEGIVTSKMPKEGRQPLVLPSDGRCDDHGYISRLKSNVEANSPPAFITGISGGLLAACLSNGIPCTGLLIPSISGIPDPEGAAILIEKANELANNPFKIDVRPLKNEAAELKRQMQELIDSVQRQQQQQDQTQLGGGQRIYS